MYVNAMLKNSALYLYFIYIYIYINIYIKIIRFVILFFSFWVGKHGFILWYIIRWLGVHDRWNETEQVCVVLAWQNSACGDLRLIVKLKAHRWHNAKNTVEATGWHKENQLHPAAQHIPKCSLPALGWKYPSISLCRYDVHQGKQSFFKAGSALGHHSSFISNSFQLSSHTTPICVLLSQLLHFPFFWKNYWR